MALFILRKFHEKETIKQLQVQPFRLRFFFIFFPKNRNGCSLGSDKKGVVIIKEIFHQRDTFQVFGRIISLERKGVKIIGNSNNNYGCTSLSLPITGRISKKNGC